MTINNQMNSVIVVAQFSDISHAQSAAAAIEAMLRTAEEQVEDLFAAQGGVADMADLTAIYARQGFFNDNGWRHETPLVTDGDELIWELPEGFVIEEAEVLLLAFGAESIEVGPDGDDEPWRHSFPPVAMMPVEDEVDSLELDEEDSSVPPAPTKKLLH